MDNAKFFHVPDIDQVTDEELYNQMLNKFPEWLKETKEKGILRKKRKSPLDFIFSNRNK